MALEAQLLLQTNPQSALTLLSMIGQAQLSIEDLLGHATEVFASGVSIFPQSG